MADGSPIVSVVMPAFNSERFIEASVRSVLEQTFQSFELIVIDDCSTDKTQNIIMNLSGKDPRIRIIKNEMNLGAAASRNRGFEQCRGEYIALIDSDDLWHREKLARQIALARKHHADIVYCSYSIVGENGRKKCPDFIVPEKTTFELLLAQNVIGCSTVLIKKVSLGRERFLTEFYHEDFVLWLRMLQNGCTAVGDPEILMTYRCVAQSRSSNKLFCAVQRWKIYRHCFNLSRIRSCTLLLQYGFAGLKKYRKM